MKRILFFFTLCSLLFALKSCKPKEIIITRTEYRDRVQYDSVYIKKNDSVIIRQKGDTVFYTKYVTLFKDKYKMIRDTVRQTDIQKKYYTITKTIVKQKELTTAQKNYIKMGKALFLFLTAWALMLIYKFRKNILSLLKKIISKLLQLIK